MIGHLTRLLESGSTFTVSIQCAGTETHNGALYSDRGIYSVDAAGIMFEAVGGALGLTWQSIEWVTVEVSDDNR